jgi:tRNA-dihydrouridine synthase
MDRLIALKGEHVAVREMRKHMAWYLKGMTGAARVKDIIMETEKRDEMVRTLDGYVEHLATSSMSGTAEESAVLH